MELTVQARHGECSNLGPFYLELSAPAIELSYYPSMSIRSMMLIRYTLSGVRVSLDVDKVYTVRGAGFS